MYLKTHRFALYILAFAGLMASAQAHAQTSVNGPYYAAPAWDQKIQCDTKATCPRFIVLANWNNDAVLDRETGLVWEKIPGLSLANWVFAMAHCDLLNLGGRMGWRLPTFTELTTLVDRSQSNPALPAGHPFTLQAQTLYWSATSVIRNPARVRLVSFIDGLFSTSAKDDGSGVGGSWCVRGGSGADPQ